MQPWWTIYGRCFVLTSKTPYQNQYYITAVDLFADIKH